MRSQPASYYSGNTQSLDGGKARWSQPVTTSGAESPRAERQVVTGCDHLPVYASSYVISIRRIFQADTATSTTAKAESPTTETQGAGASERMAIGPSETFTGQSDWR